MKIRKIREFLRRHKRFLIVTHMNPEADAIGSLLAFAAIMRSMHKRYRLVCQDAVPKELCFLPYAKQVKTSLKGFRYDAVIALDCSDASRTGTLASAVTKKPILNIDHHISNSLFGECNCVDENASSTCEMMYSVMAGLGITMTHAAAVALYAGIATDTGYFRYTNTTAQTHKIVSELLRHGVDCSRVYRCVYQKLTFDELALISRALCGVKKDATNTIAWVSLSRSLRKQYSTSIDLTDSILNYVRMVHSVEVVVLFRQMIEKDAVRINFRSRGKADVNAIAQHFGGGGHRCASGTTLRRVSLATAERNVISYIKKFIKK